MLTQVEEQSELVADASNANGVNANGVDANDDESEQYSGRVDEETNGGVSQGHDEVVAEKAPPTPAKDGDTARASRTAIPGFVSEGTSGSAT